MRGSSLFLVPFLLVTNVLFACSCPLCGGFTSFTQRVPSVSDRFVGNKLWSFAQNKPGELENGSLEWATGTASISNSNCFTVFQQALDAWLAIPNTVIKFKCLGQATADYPNQVTTIVTWSSDSSLFVTDGAYAFTYEGEATFAIVFNDTYDWSNDALLLSVAEHEIGHWLGLMHTAVQGDLMYPAVSAGEAVGSDETVAMQCWYGVPGSSTFTLSINGCYLGGPAPLNSYFVADLIDSPGSKVTLVSCNWDFGDGTTGTSGPGEYLPHTYVLAGDYNVVVTGKGSDGTTNIASNTIYVSDSSPSPSPSPAPSPSPSPSPSPAPVIPTGAVSTISASVSFNFLKNKAQMVLVLNDGNPSYSQPPVFELGGAVFSDARISRRGSAVHVTINDSSLVSVLAPYGAVNATVSAVSVSVPISLSAPNLIVSGTASFTYSAKEGKTGKGH